ncbi:hypothetical protein [Pseudoalteromonas sp. MB47]|uniref:hypothetical protein n=1 Tax=Pseudoalteromonas sp. MB47 TaxID=2588452 RepID=UPI0014073ED1|nr:hypothetical protein [Pseudoalteromonas sp. MB47]
MAKERPDTWILHSWIEAMCMYLMLVKVQVIQENIKMRKFIFLLLTLSSAIQVSARNDGYKQITWSNLFESHEKLVGEKVTLTAFYNFAGFYKDLESADSFSMEYLVFPFYGDVTKDFIKHCNERLLIVEGIISSHEKSRAPRIKKVVRLSPLSDPEYNCLDQISGFVN